MTALLVASCLPRTVAEAAPMLLAPPPGADLLELRLDALETPSVDEVRRLLGQPRAIEVIATCRAAAQGGLFRGDESERLALLAAAGRAGADLLDVEDTALAALPDDVPGQRIASCHLSRFMPRLAALVARVAGHGAAWAKVAVPAETPAQLAELLRLQQRGPPRLAIVPTGRLAEAGRILAAARGAALVYGALDPARPGHADQPDVQRLHQVFHVGVVGQGTRFFAVVGRPVAHSLSPAYHNTIFRGLGIDARLVALDVDELGAVLAQADALGLDGLAVTHPFKGAAVALADSVLPGAEASGAANTLLRTPAGWQARNTDWTAARDLLPRLLKGWRKAHPGAVPRVVLLGSGGAARAVAMALAEEEIELAIWSRRLSNARHLAEALQATLPAVAIPDPGHLPADVLINATPIGMPGVDSGELDLGPQHLRPGACVVDLAYGGPTSPVRSAARLAGAHLTTGEDFFRLQAQRQAELFTQGALPADLKHAAEAALP